MLNENQQKAALHKDGPMMVLAGPGSGKTAVITARAINLSQNATFSPVLVITYSKAAATEMQRRFEASLEMSKKTSSKATASNEPSNQAPHEAPLEALANTQSPITFGTFHSAFFRMLRRKRGHSLGEIMADGERRNAVRSFLMERNYEPDDELLSSLLLEMSLVRNELFDIEFYHSKSIAAEAFKEICKEYENYKRDKNKIDFDDMLCHTYNLFKEDEAELKYWREKYKYIMIDEFQDINRVQYELVKLLAAPANNIFVVGDDDQSIYRFRGSRPEFLLDFPKDFPENKQVILQTNYRSTDSIINYANKLILANKMRYNKNIVGTSQSGSPPIFLKAEDQNDEAQKIAEKIRTLRNKGANLDEIAVTFRLNIQARAIADAFLNLRIPFKSRDEMPTIYEHWLAQDIFAYLHVARRLALRQKTGFCPNAERIINKPFRYVGKAFLAAMKKSDKDIFKTYKKSAALHMATKTGIEELETSLTRLAKLAPAQAIRYIRKNIGYNNHITDTCEYRKLNPAGLFEMADELQDAAKPFKTTEEFIAHAKKAAAASKEQGHTGPCVTLTTLHSAKGLEFERVFITGVVEEVLPHIRSSTEAEIEEERRLFYVGVTRAKRELYISSAKTRYDKPVKPSRFLQ